MLVQVVHVQQHGVVLHCSTATLARVCQPLLCHIPGQTRQASVWACLRRSFMYSSMGWCRMA